MNTSQNFVASTTNCSFSFSSFVLAGWFLSELTWLISIGLTYVPVTSQKANCCLSGPGWLHSYLAGWRLSKGQMGHMSFIHQANLGFFLAMGFQNSRRVSLNEQVAYQPCFFGHSKSHGQSRFKGLRNRSCLLMGVGGGLPHLIARVWMQQGKNR